LIPDRDIYRTDKLLVDQHGEDVMAYAPGCADQQLADRDAEGAAIWRTIPAAIEDLQRDRGPAEA
jgi:hypothetical protein